LNALLIPHAGATGAALGTCVGSAVFFGAWLAASQRLYPLPLRWPLLAAAVAVFVALVVAGTRVDGLGAAGAVAAGAKVLALAAFGFAVWALGLLRPRGWRPIHGTGT
jgi:hypothetical protein